MDSAQLGNAATSLMNMFTDNCSNLTRMVYQITSHCTPVYRVRYKLKHGVQLLPCQNVLNTRLRTDHVKDSVDICPQLAGVLPTKPCAHHKNTNCGGIVALVCQLHNELCVRIVLSVVQQVDGELHRMVAYVALLVLF